MRESLFPTFKDPSAFAAASDVDNTSLIDLLAVKRGQRYHVFLMQLIFSESPEEHISLKHCCRKIVQNLSNSSDFETALDLHVDDGCMTRPAKRMMQVFTEHEGVIVLKLSPIIGVGDSFAHVGALRIIDNEGMWVKELDKYESSVLTMTKMKDCRPSSSPKLEKQTEPGDDDPCEHPELYRSAVCTILYMTKRRPDMQATTRWMCKRLRNPNQKSWRQLVKTVRYIKGSRDLATFMPKTSKTEIIEAFLDGDWACDDLDRKSASGGYLMVGGCRLNSHSRKL